MRRVSVVAGVASTIATLPDGARGATWGTNEQLIVGTDSRGLLGVAFDPDEIAVVGEPVRVLDGIVTTDIGSAELALSNGGRFTYVSGGRNRRAEGALGWVDRAGQVTPMVVEQIVTSFPRLSPDERYVAYVATLEIWIHDISRHTDARFTFDGTSSVPLWARDGSTLTFTNDRSGSFDIYSKPADSSTAASLVLEDPNLLVAGSLSTDGQLLYHRVVWETQRDLWVLSSDGPSSPFLESEFNEMAPRLHPHGRWVAYVSDLSGENRVYLQPFPEGGRVVPVSAGPGTEPVWSRDGRELPRGRA